MAIELMVVLWKARPIDGGFADGGGLVGGWVCGDQLRRWRSFGSSVLEASLDAAPLMSDPPLLLLAPSFPVVEQALSRWYRRPPDIDTSALRTNPHRSAPMRSVMCSRSRGTAGCSPWC